ncbi:unnamed protein product [Cyprideis torosa]|uniref:Uncharacterized protein n=1 Tax=Cyprideis torosa TaxID=163714 RepID=A0A7R8WA52_9CRUS|nr:unnamed protein product [Cyprideis torosa]CAG0888013.1 unnamed protein product [Cyprideis torosa]
MPTVISKLLQDKLEERGIPLLQATRLGASVVLAWYAYKVVLPYARKCLQTKQPTLPRTLPSTTSFLNILEQQTVKKDKPDKKQQYGVNAQFLAQMKFLLRIMIPGLVSRESLFLLLHSATLVTRTFLSIMVASLEGQVASFIVQKDLRNFFILLAKWIALAIPATIVNSTIRFLENKLALSFQNRLTSHAYRMYFANQTYYRVGNLDLRLENADHCLTEDIAQFASSVAHLYSHVTKPLLDVIILTISLGGIARKLGGAVLPGPLVAGTVIGITVLILRAITPRFGKLAAVSAARKGYLRFIHSRIIANAEEIAFYGGHRVEEAHLRTSYESMVKQATKILRQKWWYVMAEQFLVKYVWSAAGMVIVSIPMLTGSDVETTGEAVGRRTQFLTTAKNLLVSGADAVERLMTSYKEVAELAGYTARVSDMFQVFSEVNAEKYERPGAMDNKASSKALQKLGLMLVNGAPMIEGRVLHSLDNRIILVDVPIVTPAADVVVPSVNLTLTPKMHLLITGPNGCGKSSLFRIISGLWPVYKGTLYRPPSTKLFYIPQRPYMSLGTLRDQVIYPDTHEDMLARGLSDRDLEGLLAIVHLKHIVSREGGWDARRDWKDVL